MSNLIKEQLEIYDKLVGENPNFERKGKTMFFTSSNGYMFSQLNKAGEIGIRLSKKDTIAFSEKHKVNPFLSYGAKMKDYVLISNEALKNDFNNISELFQKSFEYVNSLPAK